MSGYVDAPWDEFCYETFVKIWKWFRRLVRRVIRR